MLPHLMCPGGHDLPQLLPHPILGPDSLTPGGRLEGREEIRAPRVGVGVSPQVQAQALGQRSAGRHHPPGHLDERRLA